jgi:two-component system OmpR family sensor kinase
MTDAPRGTGAGRRWGIRQRVVIGYLFLLLATVAISLVVTRHTLISRLERDIDTALVQEIEEVRLLATGDDPATAEPFGTDVAAIFRTFLGRSVPGESEAFYTFVGGRYFLRDFEAPPELLEDAALVSAWTSVTGPTLATWSTSVGETRSLAVPLLDGDSVLGVFVIVHFPADDRAEITRVVQVSAIAGLAVLVLVAAVAWSIAGRVLRPIRELTDTAQGITETDLSGRIPVTGNDELSELGTTFNAMIDRLERGFAGQRQFLDDVAHELRTPITIVQGHLELMGDDPVDRAETIAVVHDELDRMNRYVNDLLLLAKSETTEFLRPEPIDLGELAEIVQSKLPALGDRSWVLDASPAPGALAIVGDPGRLTQALLNLATNAVQHTAPGDVIAFGIEPTGTGARLWVRDTGAGLEPGLADRLFDRRFRGAASRASRADGMGLGLSIVAAIVRAHGGEIVAVNDPGGGARFTITLPTEPPNPNPDPYLNTTEHTP